MCRIYFRVVAFAYLYGFPAGIVKLSYFLSIKTFHLKIDGFKCFIGREKLKIVIARYLGLTYSSELVGGVLYVIKRKRDFLNGQRKIG
jgi:hypothetical protein